MDIILVNRSSTIATKRIKRTNSARSLKASIKNGSVKLYDPDLSQKLDISRIQDVYDNETISEIDSKIGKAIMILSVRYTR